MLLSFLIAALSVSSSMIEMLGEKIWENECGKNDQKLTHWNQGESFGSFGIGHFIWFPKECQAPMQQTFPQLLVFLQKHQTPLPPFLQKHPCCPWSSYEDFHLHIHSPEMAQLRQFLKETKSLQALFIFKRLEEALPSMLNQLIEPQKTRCKDLFFRLAATPQGLYALVDYVNFKGLGTSPFETYQGMGWGLLQVLQEIPEGSSSPLNEFIKAAESILRRRVENAPKEREEQRWLKGWIKRVHTYGQSF